MSDEELFETVKRKVLVVVPELDPPSVSIERSLAELGCNSIDRAEIVTLTMEELGIEIPTMEFARVRNLRTLVGLLREYV